MYCTKKAFIHEYSSAILIIFTNNTIRTYSKNPIQSYTYHNIDNGKHKRQSQ